jgi:Ca2+-binding EF-hand superfamily protein
MKGIKISLLVSATLAALVCHVHAGATNQMSEITLAGLSHDDQGRVPLSALRAAAIEAFKRKDTKGHGKVTIEEFLANAEVVFNEMDIKKKGYVDLDDLLRYRCGASDLTWSNAPAKEFDPKRGFYPQMAHPGHAYIEQWEFIKAWTDVFHLTDANHDGKITLQEMKDRWKIWFDHIDANHDGVITLGEFLANQTGGVKARPGAKKPGTKKAPKPKPGPAAPANAASTNAPAPMPATP